MKNKLDGLALNELRQIEDYIKGQLEISDRYEQEGSESTNLIGYYLSHALADVRDAIELKEEEDYY